MIDIRQSKNWANYLNMYGWESSIVSDNINVETKKMPIGGIAKIQRPRILNSSDLAKIEKVCKEHKAIFIKLEPAQNQDISLLEAHEYRKSYFPLLPPSTICVDLKKSEQELWNALSKSARYSVKQAGKMKSKVLCYKNPTSKEVREFYEIEKQTSKKKNFYIQSFDDLIRKVDVFGDKSHIIEVRETNGKLLGANFYLTHSDFVYFTHGATSDIGRKSNVGYGYALMWESILYFKKLEFEILDLEGKDDERFPRFTKNWGTFSYFKEKFGGETVQYPAPYIKILNPLVKAYSKINKSLPL